MAFPARKALNVTIVALALFLAAQTIVTAVFVLRGEAGAVLALVPQGFAAERLPRGVAIIAWDGPLATLAVPASSGFALYRSGALLVLPVRGTGCLALAGRTERT